MPCATGEVPLQPLSRFAGWLRRQRRGVRGVQRHQVRRFLLQRAVRAQVGDRVVVLAQGGRPAALAVEPDPSRHLHRERIERERGANALAHRAQVAFRDELPAEAIEHPARVRHQIVLRTEAMQQLDHEAAPEHVEPAPLVRRVADRDLIVGRAQARRFPVDPVPQVGGDEAVGVDLEHGLAEHRHSPRSAASLELDRVFHQAGDARVVAVDMTHVEQRGPAGRHRAGHRRGCGVGFRQQPFERVVAPDQ
jgi:hypothetical protein